ncbi:hypothetical protein EJ08DRAFT_644363 [Tothia fuscella]|uniref:Uncharacterized protein n=1 Tax=Tothia fuscella TaxID=1048955 RepID=A0A9P4P525_9PEZI|nr:hypothetical protein EJ08DRAFT_644363 [Tothia fuscella]
MGSLAPQANAYEQVTSSAPSMSERSYSDSSDQDVMAMSDYARMMHEHTKKQLGQATSSRRRSEVVSNPEHAELKHENSSAGSISSTGS